MAITVPTNLPDLGGHQATVVDQKKNRCGKMATRKSRFGVNQIASVATAILPRPTRLGFWLTREVVKKDRTESH